MDKSTTVAHDCRAAAARAAATCPAGAAATGAPRRASARAVTDGKMDSLILPYVNGDCMQIFLDEMAVHLSHRMIMVLVMVQVGIEINRLLFLTIFAFYVFLRIRRNLIR